MREKCQRCERVGCKFIAHPRYGLLCVLCFDDVLARDGVKAEILRHLKHEPETQRMAR